MNSLTPFKKILILPLLIALALVSLASPTVARADAVTDWNLIASNAIVVTAGQPPPVSVLHFAMVQGAVYDAVNAIDRGYRPYLVRPHANPTDSKAAAAATAAFRVLVGIFPGQLGTLQPLYDAYIAGLPDNPPGSKAAGIAIGEATAAAMLHRADERRTLWAAAGSVPASAGRLATDAAELRERPRTVGGERTAVHRPERREAPHRRAERAHQ